MNTYTILKIIAFVTMFIDHLGIISGWFWMRYIGRIAMPIFAFFMGYGTRVTKHEGKRIIKLGITAAISVPLTMITFENTVLNIMVQFFLFALVMWLLKKVKMEDDIWKHILEVTCMLCLSIIGYSCNLDYTWLIPILCYISYKATDERIIFATYAILIFFYPYTLHGFSNGISVNSFGVVALPLIMWFLMQDKKPAGRKIHKSKILTWLSRNIFYILYPLHVAVLLIIKILYFA